MLSGVDLGARNSRPNFGMQIGSGVPDRVLYMHLYAIADRLNEALAAGQVDRNLEIYGVGLCSSSRKKQAWPVMARIHWDRAKCCYAPGSGRPIVCGGERQGDSKVARPRLGCDDARHIRIVVQR